MGTPYAPVTQRYVLQSMLQAPAPVIKHRAYVHTSRLCYVTGFPILTKDSS